MRKLQLVFLMLILSPFASFAAQMDATYTQVSAGCYGAFRTIFSMLPEITDAMNEKAGKELVVISDVRTPLSNPSVFTMVVDKTISGDGVGTYKLYQSYVGTTLYLRIDLVPDTFSYESLEMIWGLADKMFEVCPV